jgi:hypothetical protein
LIYVNDRREGLRTFRENMQREKQIEREGCT